jgi:trehalose 6-phosphate phosphatase
VAGAGPVPIPPALRVLTADPGASALFTDFDGTLAFIVPDPADAVPAPGAEAALSRLAERLRVVGVVSGRPVSFLRRRLAGAGNRVHLAGVYGLEWMEGERVLHLPEAEPWRAPAEEVADAARASAPPGVGVELKGSAVAVHWRQAPDAGPWAREFARRWAKASGLRLQEGRMAVELRPPLPVDKGAVVTRVASGCSAVCFVGDDVGDLAGFAALDDLARRGTRTVRVAAAGEESPDELVAAADVVVDGPEGAVALLAGLAEALGG